MVIISIMKLFILLFCLISVSVLAQEKDVSEVHSFVMTTESGEVTFQTEGATKYCYQMKEEGIINGILEGIKVLDVLADIRRDQLDFDGWNITEILQVTGGLLIQMEEPGSSEAFFQQIFINSCSK